MTDQANEEYGELIKMLEGRGHSPEEIEKILNKIKKYDEETQFDSVMDSIGAGRLSLNALIKEALEE